MFKSGWKTSEFWVTVLTIIVKVTGIVDLPVGAFEAVCGVEWRRGLCPVTLTILGRAK